MAHENVPEIGDACDCAHRSGKRLRGRLGGRDIGNDQEAQQEPQRILDPVEFFDKTTGKVKVWYWRAESGYEFYDAPGFHPRTGEALTGVTLDVITKWQQSQQNAKQCYIIQRGARAPVIYRDHLPGMDPETGRECRLVTTGLIERLKEYAEGKRPGRIKARPPEFFDPRTSEPIVWYVDHGGAIEFFDLLGYHPETSEELLPVTPEIVDRWKAQQAQASKKPPAPVDPETHPFFDPKTGRPNIWHSPGESGALEFFDGPGFHPRTGKALTEITRDFADKRSRERADSLAREEKERDDRIAREQKERDEQQAQASKKPPAPVDPETHPFFDPKTGRPNIWHSPGESGALEFFDGPGFHPRTGKALTEITRDFADKRLRERADSLAREQKERDDRIAREQKERNDREAREQKERRPTAIAREQKERDDREAREQKERDEREERQEQQRRKELAKQSAAACDVLAANPNDQRRHSKGMVSRTTN